jgi:plasmid maintenance system antidote protein VapI
MADWLTKRTMTHTQYQRAITRLGLSQLAAGRFLGVSKNTAQRLASGDTTVPVAVALLLNKMIEDGVSLEGSDV